MFSINKKDLQIIRDIAKKQYEYSNLPRMKELKKEWLLHNTFKGNRPMIVIELGDFKNELLPQLLKCESEEARKIEESLYRNIIHYELFGDDFVVRDHYPVVWDTDFKAYNLDEVVEYAKGGSIGHRFVPIINNLQEDFEKLGKSAYYIDKERTFKRINMLNEILGDILPVKLKGICLRAIPTQKIVHIMGMESMLFSMYDYPGEFKKMMDMITNDYIEYYRFLEDNKAILTTNGDEALGQGTWCYTDELPGMEESNKRVFTSKDVWGAMNSQETVGISNEMFGEFIFPYYKRIADEFGLVSYGCCEPVDGIWDQYLSKMTNLRKLSISPWCNEEFIGERIQGKNIIYHRKPSPNFLGIDKILDENAVTAHIDKTLLAARGCKIEFTQRDVLTIHNDPGKVRRYVEIIRQRCEKNYK